MQCTHHHIYNHPAIIKLRYDAVDQGAHIRERLTANRSDLTLQSGPNQHGTYLPVGLYMPTIPLPISNYRNQPNDIWSAELNVRPPKVNICIPISPRLLDYPRSWVRVPVLSKQGSTRLTGFDYLLLLVCG